MKVNPYRNKYKCPKCGFPYHNTNFCINTESCKCHAKHPYGEHLEITCRNCGYIWAEKTKDKKSENPLQE